MRNWAVDDPATGQGQIGLNPVQLAPGGWQRAPVALEQGALVEQPGSLDALIRAHPLSVRNSG
jgi:hypothetical protein